MTNKQWLMWKMIDMSDEDFADIQCKITRCDDCPGCGEHSECIPKLRKWLKQEHEDESQAE